MAVAGQIGKNQGDSLGAVFLPCKSVLMCSEIICAGYGRMVDIVSR